MYLCTRYEKRAETMHMVMDKQQEQKWKERKTEAKCETDFFFGSAVNTADMVHHFAFVSLYVWSVFTFIRFVAHNYKLEKMAAWNIVYITFVL